MAFVIKVQYNGSLRRLTVPAAVNGAPALNFSQLRSKICDSFEIPNDAKLLVTYVDKDNDVITMTSDQEFEDACVHQGLNPLRLNVKVESSEGKGSSEVNSLADLKPFVESAVKKTFDVESLKDVLELILARTGLPLKIITQALSEIRCGESSTERPANPGSGSNAPPPANRGETPRGGEAPPSGMEGVNPVHYSVQCDGCGMSPIVGPRFKSRTKHDFDLCVMCFTALPAGSDADYVRHDKPIVRNPFHQYLSSRVKPVPQRCPAFPPNRCRGAWRDKWEWGRQNERWEWGRSDAEVYDRVAAAYVKPSMDMAYIKPDGRFVCDVTIPDGTEVSPNTRFVKIWRLRNSGRIAWAPDTKMVRVGGDEMGTVSAVSLQMPPGGIVPPEAEVEVAVDLVAPSRPGRYVTYWRLTTSHGVKFGHRVWALIQVTPAPFVEVAKTKEADDSPLVDVDVDGASSDVEAEIVLEASEREVADLKSVADNVVVEAEPEAVEPEPETEDDIVVQAEEVEEGFSLVEKSGGGEVGGQASANRDHDREGDREAKLQLLLSMGFTTKKELIVDLLEKNGNDFNRTLDDLVVAAEWDPLLAELEEMGFNDAAMNRRLMIKNNGSVKRVVKELVQLYATKPAEVISLI